MEVSWVQVHVVLVAYAVANHHSTKISKLVIGDTANPSTLTPCLMVSTDKGDFAVDVTPATGEVRVGNEGELTCFTYKPTVEGVELLPAVPV